MKRRIFLLFGAAVAATNGQVLSVAAKGDATLDDIVRNWKALLAEGSDVSLSVEPIRKSKAEWQQILTPAQFSILRDEATERPGTSPLDGEKRPGVFVCAGCSLPLFTSRMKFDSHTGWPSFFTAIPDHLKPKSDFRLEEVRVEYHCVRCGGHQGHLFDDGPQPTGQRWCNNGIALRFIPL